MGVPISVVIPVLDEAHCIAKVLVAVRGQSHPPDEIIVVDGGSTDGTQRIVAQVSLQDETVILVEAGSATPGRGRNIGVASAAGDWIAFIDAGVQPDAHWLERLVRAAKAYPDVDAVFGALSTAGLTFFERCADLAYVPSMRDTARGPIRSDAIACSLIRRTAYEAAGPFPDLRAAEDLIFLRKLKAVARRIEYAPEAEVTWQLQSTPASTFRRFRSYSMHNVAAGQQRYWHHGVARQWLAAMAVVGTATLARRQWPLWLLPAGLAGRTGRTLARRREGRSWAWVVRPLQFSTVAGIIALIDAATLFGWVDALLSRRRQDV